MCACSRWPSTTSSIGIDAIVEDSEKMNVGVGLLEALQETRIPRLTSMLCVCARLTSYTIASSSSVSSITEVVCMLFKEVIDDLAMLPKSMLSNQVAVVVVSSEADESCRCRPRRNTLDMPAFMVRIAALSACSLLASVCLNKDSRVGWLSGNVCKDSGLD